MSKKKKVILAVGGTGGHLFPADRKSTRLNSSHLVISYAVFCLKKKTCRLSGKRTLKVDAGPRPARSLVATPSDESIPPERRAATTPPAPHWRRNAPPPRRATRA